MRLEGLLSAGARPEGLRRMLFSASSRRILRQELGALAAEPQALGRCYFQHARFKAIPEAKLSACFHLSLRNGALDRSGARPVFVTWKPKWVGRLSANGANRGDIQLEREASRRGLAAPFRRLSARVPAWGMRIQIFPLDPEFPHLVRWSDGNYLCRILAARCQAAQLPPVPVAKGRVEVEAVRYAPGERHVLRYGFFGSTRRSSLFAKVYQDDGQAIGAFTAAKGMAEWLRAKGKEVAALRPLEHVVGDTVVLYPGVTGVPLHRQLSRRGRESEEALKRAGRAIRALHEAPPTLAGSIKLHDLEAEVEEIRQKSGVLSLLIPSAGPAIAGLFEDAKELFRKLPQEPPTYTHGDVKAEHFWLTADGVIVLDLDCCRLGDPALDLGLFLAELNLWADLLGKSGVEQAQERVLAGYAPGAPRDRLIRARFYESLELVRAAARRLPMWDRGWENRVARLVGRATRILDGFRKKCG